MAKKEIKIFHFMQMSHSPFNTNKDSAKAFLDLTTQKCSKFYRTQYNRTGRKNSANNWQFCRK